MEVGRLTIACSQSSSLGLFALGDKVGYLAELASTLSLWKTVRNE